MRRLDLEQRLVLVDDFPGTYYTQAKVDKHVLINGQGLPRVLAEGVSLFFGEIEVTEQVVAYQKRDITDGRVLDTTTLDLPEQVFTTEAFWLTLSPDLLQTALAGLSPETGGGEGGAPLRGDADGVTAPSGGVGAAATDAGPHVPGTLHAAEHALIALLPLYAMCDRWDVGGLSTPWHWQTDLATIFVYDGYPGGIGLSRRAHDAFPELAADARRLVAECPCEAGCPSCVQSPKCGNLNEPLSKAGAVRLLDAVLAPGRRAEDTRPVGPVPTDAGPADEGGADARAT